MKNFVKLVAFKVLQKWYRLLLHLHKYSTYYIDNLQLKCNIKLNCNNNSISNQSRKLKINSFLLCFVANYMYSYKILADIRKNLLEAKICNCFVSSHGNMQWQLLLFMNSLHPNTSEVYKMNTFSLNSVLEKTFI